jgi:hypothetical protein
VSEAFFGLILFFFFFKLVLLLLLLWTFSKRSVAISILPHFLFGWTAVETNDGTRGGARANGFGGMGRSG